MRFVVDAQLPGLLVNWLCSKGHDAAHVLVVLGEGAPDSAVVEYAAGGVIVSKDGDFLSLIDGLTNPPGFLWVRCGKTRNGALLDLFERDWGRVERELSTGVHVVELG